MAWHGLGTNNGQKKGHENRERVDGMKTEA
jgi:hypothetical protein